MNIITNVETLPLLVMYRQLLANSLLRDQEEPTRLKFYQPSLAKFPKLVSDPIVAQALAEKWYARFQQFTRKERVRTGIKFGETFLKLLLENHSLSS